MAAITSSVPSAGHRLRGAARRVLRAAQSAASSLASPHRAALANLRAIPLTVAGTGSVDFASFHLAHGWGWLVTGISLVVVEHIIADEA